MFRKVNWKHSLTFGGIAGLLFCIPAFVYIQRASYNDSWLLYLGSMLFFLVIVADILVFNKKRGGNDSTVAMVFESHMTTLIGVLTSLLICLILLMIMVPGFFHSGMADKQLTDAPANTIHDKTNGLNFKVFALALIANFSFGSFASIIFPFTAKRNQMGDRRDPAPLHQAGRK
jgi:hypothetical protein